MNKSICIFASNCGAFDARSACTIADMENCGGRIKPTPKSLAEFEHLLPEFKPGKCKFCGEAKDVAVVNSSTKACRVCLIAMVLPRKTAKNVQKTSASHIRPV